VDLIKIQHTFTTAATVIGFAVMCGWVLLAVWFLSTIVGEIRFNRIMKRRLQRDSDNRHSSWVFDDPFPTPDDGPERTDTRELPIGFKFHSEDDLPTEETGAVFDIRERYPHEFA
jgi:hypothetical protein